MLVVVEMEIGYAKAEVSGSRGIVIPARLFEGITCSLVVSCLYLLYDFVEEPCIGVLLVGLGRGGRNSEEQRRKDKKGNPCHGYTRMNAVFC